MRTLARLAVEQTLTSEQVAAWNDDQVLATMRRLLESDDFLAPDEGEAVTFESFRAAGRREAAEDQGRWERMASLMAV